MLMKTLQLKCLSRGIMDIFVKPNFRIKLMFLIMDIIVDLVFLFMDTFFKGYFDQDVWLFVCFKEYRI